MEYMNKQTAILENYINDIPLITDPCRLCVNCTGVRGDITTHLTEYCKDCCFFYDSKFKAKEVKG